MGWLNRTGGRVVGPPALAPGPHRWAIVDVETSGLYANSNRVLSVAALALDPQGGIESQVVSLVDADCDPGPVHVHGLTRQRLAGAPAFAQVLPDLQRLLDGRVMVAHNAAFDHGFLSAEASRAGQELPTRQRLCTLALSRRLGVDVPNYKLTTLARHWEVPHGNAHDALDDARTLVGVFAHSLDLARRLDLPLPVVHNDAHPERVPFPARVVKTPCPWHYPGRLSPGGAVTQGMKIVITGDTRLPREQLIARLVAQGLEVTTSVSRLTSLIVCSDPSSPTEKSARARAEGIPALDEATVLRLVADVRPGVLKSTGPAVIPTHRPSPPSPPGPLARRRVLVIGGSHEQAVQVRADLASLGGAAAVNLSANVTDLILLEGGDRDSRLARALAAGVRVHTGPFALGVALPGTSPTTAAEVTAARVMKAAADDSVRYQTRVLPRGAALDLPPGDIWSVNVAWRADALADGAELDLVAFLVDPSERVVTDEDFVFYNAPVSEGGAVTLSLDGDSEQSVRIDLRLLPGHCSRVVVAAALSNETTFGRLGALNVTVEGDDNILFGSTLDAGTTEQSMVIAELYLRQDRWRVRPVGQGYDEGLHALAVRYGVDVE